MKAKYWPCRGVQAAVDGAGLRDTRASLCGEGGGSVDESPGEGPAEGVGLRAVPVSNEAEHVVSEGRHTLETAVAQDAALKDAEPESRPG